MPRRRAGEAVTVPTKPGRLELKLTLPIAADALGRWLAANGAGITIQCALGTYSVHVGRKKVLSYSDARGQHSEHWEVARYDRDLMVALEGALREAGAFAAEEPLIP